MGLSEFVKQQVENEKARNQRKKERITERIEF